MSDREWLDRKLMREMALGFRSFADPEVRDAWRRVHGFMSRSVVRRSFAVPRLRAASTREATTLSGLAAGYDVTYSVAGGVREKLARGAFDASVRERPTVPLFYEHSWTDPVGAASLRSTAVGVEFAAEMFDGERARSVALAATAGALREVSIGFLASEVRPDAREKDVEVVHRGELLELSVVVKAASPVARIEEVTRK